MIKAEFGIRNIATYDNTSTKNSLYFTWKMQVAYFIEYVTYLAQDFTLFCDQQFLTISYTVV